MHLISDCLYMSAVLLRQYSSRSAISVSQPLEVFGHCISGIVAAPIAVDQVLYLLDCCLNEPGGCVEL